MSRETLQINNQRAEQMIDSNLTRSHVTAGDVVLVFSVANRQKGL